jgi:chromosome partitioning protein
MTANTNRPLIVAVANQKGGVAKTTTAISIAHGLTILTTLPSVILVDLDQQGQCSIGLGAAPAPAVFDYLVGDNLIANCVAYTDRERLRLMAGNARTKHVDLIYRTETNGFDLLCDRLRAITDYGALVIDTPTAGLLQEAAIRIADVVVIPARCETLSVDSVHATISMAYRLNPAARVIILPTMYDKRLSEHAYNLGVLANLSSVRTADPIPARAAVIDASAAGRTIWESGDPAIRPVQAAYTSLLETITEGEAE